MSSMKKIFKNVIYTIIITIMAGLILLIPSQSKAVSVDESMQLLNNISNSHAPYTGNIPLRFGILQQRHDLYCLGYEVTFQGWQTYKNTKYIRIVGNTATDYTSGVAGTTVSHINNGILAYILSTDGGYGYAPGQMVDIANYSQTQRALYKFINTWCETPGSAFGLGAWGNTNNNNWINTPNSIYDQAVGYANSIGNTTSNSEVIANDTTNRDNIAIDYYTENEVSYVKVGPFNWTFTGKLDSVKLTGNNDVQPEIRIYKADAVTQTDASGIESGKNFYISFRADTGITSISRLEGTGKNSSTGIISADVWFLENVRYDTQNVLLANCSTEEPKSYTIVTENIPLTLDFSVVKVDEYDQTIVLPNVGFKFYNKDAGKYLQFVLNDDNEVTQVNYVDTIEEATELSTDENGRIELNGVLAGTYIAYETKNPNYGYVVDSNGKEIVPSNTEEIIITNTPEYVKLSGMVWLDKQSEKMSVRNELYRLDDNDDQDVLMEGIKVTLKDRRTGEPVTERIEGLAEDQVIVNPTYTDAEGNYHFDYVSSADLSNYYVEFEYDGMVYQNVTPHLENVEKGSKASEPDRQTFNNNYSTIERGNTELQASAKDSQGNEHGRVNYTVQEQSELKRILEMESTESCEIIATTDAAGYAIDFENRDENNEIKHINLGVYERLQTDLSIRSEIAKVTAEINGYGHVYNYMVGENALGNQSIEDWNLGIRTYDGRYKNAYERPIYKADAEYTNQDTSKELKMTMTYEISIINESQLYSKINQIVSYFNNKYIVNAIGTSVNEQGEITGKTLQQGDYTVESYNDSFNRLTINTGALNEIINPSTVAAEEGEQKVTQQKVYVQFNLSRQAIVDMLNEGDTKEKTLDFVSEIASFTSYSDRNGTLYAAYDLDSVPNNATLNNESTYEDDTEKASPIALTIAEPRQIEGTIFEDNQVANDQNTAEGNGVFDGEENETKLNGVTVELIDESTKNPTSYVNDDGQTVTPTIEMKDGDYKITGFIPGEYQVRFTWGNGTTRVDGSLGYDGGTEEITVENYKSTVMDYNTYNSETENRKYYMDDGIMNGRSQAIDNTETRAEIDQALQNYNYASDSSIETMTASTLPMTYSIEYDTDDLTNVVLEGNNIRFLTDNMNFGIIRRAKPGLELEKTVSNFKLTLPTGQVLIDATIDENGNLRGETNYLSYIGDPTDPSSAVIRAELDENLIQGSQLEVTYTLRATNVGQADFLSSDYGYYRFGETYYNAVGQEQKDQDIITSSPALIVDYLDESLQYSESSQINIDNEWQLVQLDANASEDENRNQLDIQTLENVLTHKYTDSEGNEIDLGNYTIYKTPCLADRKLRPKYSRNETGDSATVQMVATQNLSSGTDAGTINQAEIILLTKPGGGEPSHTPGNYIPDPNPPDTIPGKEIDDTPSPEIVVIPSTGGNMNYVLPITVGVVACIILAGGVFLIKTKVLKKKDE